MNEALPMTASIFDTALTQKGVVIANAAHRQACGEVMSAVQHGG